MNQQHNVEKPETAEVVSYATASTVASGVQIGGAAAAGIAGGLLRGLKWLGSRAISSAKESTAFRSLAVKARQSWEAAVMETQQRKARVQQPDEKGERPGEEDD
jgi:hypothetical protein